MNENKSTLQQINAELKQVMDEIAEAKRLDKVILSIEDEQRELKKKCHKLEEQLRKEEEDVEKLKKMSLSNFLHTLLNDKAEKLNKEEQEAFEAKLKYDSAVAELQASDNSLSVYKNKYNEVSGSKRNYSILMDKKKSYIEQYMPDQWESIEKMTNAINVITSQLKELNEAIQAGNRVMSTIGLTEEALSSAANWGTYDMIGGGTIATMVKRDKMHTAQNHIHTLQNQMRTFSRELKDVDTYLDVDLQINSFLGFADYFFDGLIVDWAVQSKINDAKNKIYNVRGQIQSIMSNIQNEKNQLTRQKSSLEHEIEHIVKDIQ
ncbi:hypothetical protein [Vallitalea okinawensis]|uniref:hypothetical protein n=1 Tax=Vallitalea okinawensis TaxID=2078660 RepID=UPI000CFD5DE4|nr:hypothetical protein [Vallitalea okinawensis]